LYFKGDDLNKEKYLRQGSEPFTYTTTKRTTTMAYWKVPPEVLEDPKSITPWIEEAVKAGKRAYKERTTKR
jgi:TfoX/Sxy family transcriptional regulator of competence genes